MTVIDKRMGTSPETQIVFGKLKKSLGQGQVKSFYSTKTNYWSLQASEINEKVKMDIKGDGIPHVRRLLPRTRSTSDSTMKKKFGTSILSYLIQKSKHK